MQKKLIFILVLMVLVAVFALQNSTEVAIKLWFWSIKTSMVLVLILTFASGALVGILFSIPKRRANPKASVHSTEHGSHDSPSAEDDPGDNNKTPGKLTEFEDVNN